MDDLIDFARFGSMSDKESYQKAIEFKTLAYLAQVITDPYYEPETNPGGDPSVYPSWISRSPVGENEDYAGRSRGRWCVSDVVGGT